MSQISFRQEEARLRRRVLAVLEIAHLKKTRSKLRIS